MSKQSVRTGPSDDDTWDTEVDYEDQFKVRGAGSNARRLDITQGIFYLGSVKYFFTGGNVSLVGVADGTYDLVLDTLYNVSLVAVGAEAANQFSLYRCVILSNHCLSATDIRVGQVKPGAGGAGAGVDTQDDTVPVDTPATTIDFGEGLDATGGGGTTTVDTHWEDDAPEAIAAVADPGVASDEVSRKDHVHSCTQFGAIPDPGVGILAVGPASVDGISPDYARLDHEHEGVHSVSANGGAGNTGDVDLRDGTGFSFTDLGGGVIQGDYTGTTVPSPGAGILAVGAANVDGVSADYARVDHVHEGVHSVAKSGDPALTGDVTLTEGANVTITQVANNIQIAASGGGAVTPGGGDQEKAWDYHELLKLIEPDMPAGFANNGMPSQRQIQMVTTDGVTKILILWHDGQTTDAKFYLTTVYTDNSPTYRYTVHTTEISLIVDSEAEVPIVTIPDDFCLVTQMHPQDGQIIHLVFVGQDGADTTQNVYDACMTGPGSVFADTILPPSATPDTLQLNAHRVNGVSSLDQPCQHVSATAVNALTQGAGLVVVWSQPIIAQGIYHILSSAWDDTYVSPANPYAGGNYQADCLVSTQVPAPAYDSVKPTVEVGNGYIHCCYVRSDGVTNLLWYSNTLPTFPALLTPTWNNVNGSDVESAAPAGLGLDVAQAPSMVIVYNGSQARDEVIVVVNDQTLLSNSLHWYAFDDTLAQGVPPAYIADGYTDLLDDTRQAQLLNRYQLGLSHPDYSGEEGSEGPWVYLYKLMSSDVANDTVVDFILQYAQWGAFPDPAVPWASVPIICGQADRVTAAAEMLFTPKVHYSNDYPVRSWKEENDSSPWYPINIYLKIKVNLIWADVAYDFSADRIMILKDIPLYLFGGNVPAP
jgi:hypothetical protein